MQDQESSIFKALELGQESSLVEFAAGVDDLAGL
jgi:hypothetical protein